MTYPSIDAHLQWCRAAGYATATTIADRRDVLMRVASTFGSLDDITGDQLAGWLGRPRWSPQTRATYYGHLMGYYRWARRFGLIDANPMDLLDRPRVPHRAPRPAAHEAYQRIMRDAPWRWRMAATLARLAGYRAAEIARAQRDDIEEDALRILGKGGREDVLPTHPAIWEMVRHLPAGNLIVTRTGRPYSPGALSNGFSTGMQRIGLPGLGLHRLRHTYGTWLMMPEEDGGAGASMRVAQTAMRHASPATTAVYTQVADRELRRRILKLPAAA